MRFDTTHVFPTCNLMKYKKKDIHTADDDKRDLLHEEAPTQKMNEHKHDQQMQSRKEATSCRERLQALLSLTYNVENLTALKELNSSLA